MSIYQLGLHGVAHYKWWSITKKDELIFKLTKFNSNSTIRLKLNWKEMRYKLTTKKMKIWIQCQFKKKKKT